MDFLSGFHLKSNFLLVVGLEKSANLTTFTPFPFLAPQTTMHGQGKIEFLFT